MGERQDQVIEFDCMDCGLRVIQIIPFAANDPGLCMECSWLRGIEDTEQRKALQQFLRRNA
jgi:hypothetical protein